MEPIFISTRLDDGILIISLNKPDKLNAWDYAMHGELNHAVEAANRNPEVDGIVITGNGKAFCAGADMSSVFGLSEEQKLKGRTDSNVNEWISLLRRSKPVVAAVNGAAVGIGITLILAVDQIIAASDAKFILAFVKMGIVPELGSSALLQRRIAFGTVSRLLLTGDPVSAEQARDIGLVDNVVTPESLLAEACAMARRMGRNPHTAIVSIKQLLTQNAVEIDLDLVQQRERDALKHCFESAEHKEAVASFMEKRTPHFKSLRR